MYYYDSLIPLSFMLFGIPHNLKSTVQQTGEISGVFEILFSLMYSRMVLTIACCRFSMPFDANGRVFTLMSLSMQKKRMLIQSNKSANEYGLNKMNVFLR